MRPRPLQQHHVGAAAGLQRGDDLGDRKSTRLNSSHSQISYAVFCLKKKHSYIACIVVSSIQERKISRTIRSPPHGLFLDSRDLSTATTATGATIIAHGMQYSKHPVN